MSLASVRRAEAALLLPTYARFPVLFQRGRGCRLYDAAGRAYLDFLSGIGVNALGYDHPAIRRALREQARRVLHISNLFYHDHQATLARRLKRISGLDRVFFTNSGTEAIEGALKLARAHARHKNANGRRPPWRILALENSFHGRTFAALAATGQKKYREPFAPLVPGVRFVRFNDIADLERKFDSTVCALLVEPLQGEGGIRPLDPKFFARCRALANRHRALLIADEIQCGLGRTGRYFAYQHYGIEPDVVTVAKPLGAGLPLGAILAREQVAGAFHPGIHGTTFGGGPLACAVATAFLQTLERERLLGRVRRLGRACRDGLEKLKQKYEWIREVRGLGLMLGMELAFSGKPIVRAALARGLVINCTNETTLRFLPPYVINERDVEHMLATLDAIFRETDKKRKAESSRNGSRRRQTAHA